LPRGGFEQGATYERNRALLKERRGKKFNRKNNERKIEIKEQARWKQLKETHEGGEKPCNEEEKAR